MAPRRAAAQPPARRARSSRASRLPSTLAHDVAAPSSPPIQTSAAGRADGELGSRMGQAVQELASTPVEEGRHIGSSLAQALHDLEFVERASRWRGGNYGRQVASVLAKVAKYLRLVKPEILDTASTASLQPVRPLPLGPAAAAPTWWTRAQQRLADSLPRLGSHPSWFIWWGGDFGDPVVSTNGCCDSGFGAPPMFARFGLGAWPSNCRTVVRSSVLHLDRPSIQLGVGRSPCHLARCGLGWWFDTQFAACARDPLSTTKRTCSDSHCWEASPPPPALLSSSLALTVAWWWLYRRPPRTGGVGGR